MVGIWAGLWKKLRWRKKKKDWCQEGQMDHFIQRKRSFDTDLCKICTNLLQFRQNPWQFATIHPEKLSRASYKLK